MVQRWDDLTFLHWSYDAATVQALLPPGIEVETYDGLAWVGLVPFRMTVLPASRFPETNVRTYVRGPDGRTGVWFFSLDADNLGAVATARATLNLPYQYARMAVGRRGDTVRYRSRRHLTKNAPSDVAVEVGAPYDAPTDFDHWLTARFRLWTTIAGRPGSVRAHHPPWPLRHARVTRLDSALVESAGLPAPHGEPLVHFSDGVRVKIGF
ncbi:MAG TPA: DUF2071 domain-containing protein [Mycobacteriales bacterium]|jgi:hypothetical protein